jgi:hypothetical protein
MLFMKSSRSWLASCLFLLILSLSCSNNSQEAISPTDQTRMNPSPTGMQQEHPPTNQSGAQQEHPPTNQSVGDMAS